MAVPGWTGRIIVDRWDFSTKTSGFTIDFNAQAIEAPTLQNPAVPTIPGVPTTMIEQKGYFQQPGAGELEQEIQARLGTGSTKMACIMGTELAVPVGYVLDPCFASKLNINAAAKELFTLDAAWAKSGGAANRGYQIWHGAITSITSGPILDFGAGGIAGGAAWFFLHDHTGAGGGSIVCNVLSSADSGMAGAVTEATFTMIAETGYSATMTGTIGRYIRLETANMGGFSAFTGTCIVAVQGVTYN